MRIEDFFGEVIFRYTRQQAIQDGVLVDVSDMAKEAGIKVPVAITARAHAMIEEIPPKRLYQDYMDYMGRLWDVLIMAIMEATRNKEKRSFLFDIVLYHGNVKFVTLKWVIHSGDEGEPVVTIMLPFED